MSVEHWIIIGLYGTGVLLMLIAFYEDTTPKNIWKLYCLALFWPLITIWLTVRVILEKALED